MRFSRKTALFAALGISTFGACVGTQAEPEGAPLQVKIAALALEGVDNVCYDLLVGNGTASPVWSQGDPLVTRTGADQRAEGGMSGEGDTATICSNQYGNGSGGDVTYVGTCDASADADGNLANGVQNLVTIWVDGLYGADGDDIGDWQDPCPDGCQLSVDCTENADSLVEFNLTILRRASQGFFDIAVNFEDIFCSAKFDTCYDRGTANDWIQLLHKDTDGDGAPDTRWDTGVLGFACTGGAGADTNLYFDSVTIACNTGTFQLDPSHPEGGNVAAPEGQDVVFGYATYFGDEELDCGGTAGSGTCRKKYWNMSIGFNTNEAHRFNNDSCTLYATATASDGQFDPEWVTPARTAYPVVSFAIPLTVAADLTLNCGQWGLGDPSGSFVSTTYTSLDCEGDDLCEAVAPALSDCDFCHHFGGAAPEQSTRAECGTGGAVATCETLDDRWFTCEGVEWSDAMQAGYDAGFDAGAASVCTRDDAVKCCTGADCYCSGYCASQCRDTEGAYAEGYNAAWREANADNQAVGECAPCPNACAPNSVNNLAGGLVEGELDGRVVSALVPPNGFVDANGLPVSGAGCNVEMAILAGGEFAGGYELRGGETFEPIAMADFSFTTTSGTPIFVDTANSASVVIHLPLPENNNGFAEPGDRIDFYYYDEANSEWVFEAEGVVLAGPGGLLEAVASVTHFTWYGVGIPATNSARSCVKVTVKNDLGQPLEGVVIRATSGTAYFQPAATTTTGYRCLQTRALAQNVISIESVPAGLTIPASVTLPANPSASCAGSGCQVVTFIVKGPVDVSRCEAKILGAGPRHQAGYGFNRVGDINGDNKADIGIGAAHGFTPDHPIGDKIGAIYVVSGAVNGHYKIDDPTGLGYTLKTWRSNVVDDGFGTHFDVGDVTGDGKVDLVAGAYRRRDATFAPCNAGAIYVFDVQTAGAPFATMRGLGAFNDIIDGTLRCEQDYLGYRVSAGDVTGDGVADVIGASGWPTYFGSHNAAYVFAGPVAAGETSAATAGIKIQPSVTEPPPGSFALQHVAWADVNGDGVPDLLLGNILDDAGGANAGALYVFYGPIAAGTLDTQNANAVIRSTVAGGYLGVMFGHHNTADFNKDGFNDLLVGAFGATTYGPNAGAVYLFNGPLSGSYTTANATAAWYGSQITGEAADAGSAGDFNRDGWLDIVIGSDGADFGGARSGAAYVYYGPIAAQTNQLVNASLILRGSSAGAEVGFWVSGIGDGDGDGFDDIAITSPYDDENGEDAGAVYICRGRASGL